MEDRGARQGGDEGRERPLLGREQLEDLGERRHRVVSRHDVRKHEPTRRGGGEHDAVLRRGASQLADGVRRPHDAQGGALDDLLDEPGRRDRHGDLSGASRAGEELGH